MCNYYLIWRQNCKKFKEYDSHQRRNFKVILGTNYTYLSYHTQSLFDVQSFDRKRHDHRIISQNKDQST